VTGTISKKYDEVKSMRVAVIGSGVVGSSVAWHLAAGGAEVVLIDAHAPGAGVSNSTVGWVNASNKTQTREYFDLNVASMLAYRELVREVGPGEWWHPTGHLRWFDDPLKCAQLRALVDLLQSWGYDVEYWTADRVRRHLEPDVRFPGPTSQIAFFPDEGWIDGRDLALRLVDQAMARGAEAHFGRAVTQIIVRGESVTEIVLSNGQRYEVDAVVNAAGPSSDEVADLIGRKLPMRDEPGLLVRLGCDRVAIRRVMHAPHVELRPDRPGQVVIHSREIDALINATADVTDLSERLRALAVEVVPALGNSEIVGAKVAYRPIPLDGFPSVGGVDRVSGYFEAVTHSGITLAAIVGRVLSQEILQGSVDDLVSNYRPSRLGDGDLVRPTA
jgi:glycine/D-amino acid oxidase-like deaminating enzyme